jgi:SAM-dependent methyltransferase
MSESSSYYNSTYHAERYPELISDETYFQARAEVQARFYFTADEQRLRVFEYGCGIGQGIAGLPNATGWDISKKALDQCRQRGLRVVDDLDDVPRGSWDIVFCRHVLEHLEEPLAALKCMRELIGPGGELYLVLPKEKHSYSSFIPDLDQHLYCWNFRTLNNLLLRAGLVPYHNEYRYALGWRALLPIRTYLGKAAYYHATTLGGIFRRNGELIARARLS